MIEWSLFVIMTEISTSFSNKTHSQSLPPPPPLPRTDARIMAFTISMLE